MPASLPASEAVTVTTLDLSVILKSNRSRLKAIADLAKLFPRSGGDEDPDRFLSGSLLFEEADAPRFMSFHIDRLPSDGQEYIFAHLHLRPKPSNKPPVELRRHLEAGRHVAWLLSMLKKISGRAEPIVVTDAKLRLQHWARRKPALLAAPLEAAGSVLTACGAEYVNRESLSVRRFRWKSIDDDVTEAWLTYVSPGSALQADDVWEAQSAQCVKLLNELL